MIKELAESGNDPSDLGIMDSLVRFGGEGNGETTWSKSHYITPTLSASDPVPRKGIYDTFHSFELKGRRFPSVTNRRSFTFLPLFSKHEGAR